MSVKSPPMGRVVVVLVVPGVLKEPPEHTSVIAAVELFLITQ
jgi:hypothetical protein